jgi:hypothetical protein
LVDDQQWILRVPEYSQTAGAESNLRLLLFLRLAKVNGVNSERPVTNAKGFRLEGDRQRLIINRDLVSFLATFPRRTRR